MLHLLHHPQNLLNHLNTFHGGQGRFKLNAKFDADSLLYSLSHFECDGHTVHLLTPRSTTPLTSTVKSSLFTHGHSSPVSLAARLLQCHANHSRYIKDGWTFSGQTSCSKSEAASQLQGAVTMQEWRPSTAKGDCPRESGELYFSVKLI